MNGKMQYSHSDLKSTLFMGGQNAKFICQTWTFLVEFDVCVQSIQGDWFA